MTTKSIAKNHRLSQKPKLSLLKYRLIGTEVDIQLHVDTTTENRAMLLQMI